MTEVRTFPSIPKKILLPVDFSPSSHAALEMAADLALHFGAELYLVHVIPVFPTTHLPDFFPEAEVIQKATGFAERHLAKYRETLTARGVQSDSSVEAGNDIAGSIKSVVDREHIDMLVISTHGISGWHPLVFGSNAEKVIKLVQCPLLLLRSTQSEKVESSPSGR